MNVLSEPHTLPQLAKLAGIEYRTAHLWMRRGLLHPSIREAEGTGHPALFTTDDVKRAITLRSLRRWLTPEGLELVADPAERSHLHKVLNLLPDVSEPATDSHSPSKADPAADSLAVSHEAAVA